MHLHSDIEREIVRRIEGGRSSVDIFSLCSKQDRVCVCACGCSGAWMCTCACIRETLLIQHSARVRHIVLLFLASLAPAHYWTLFHIAAWFSERSYWKWNMYFAFSLTFIWNISYPKKNSARYCHKCEKSSYKVHVIRVRFQWNLNLFDRVLKNSNIKFHQNSSSRSRVVPCGRTDGHDEANSRFSQFWECS